MTDQKNELTGDREEARNGKRATASEGINWPTVAIVATTVGTVVGCTATILIVVVSLFNSLSNDIGQVNSALLQMSADIAANGAAIETLSANVASNGDSISALADRVGGIEVRIGKMVFLTCAVGV